MPAEFRVLGPLEIRRDGATVPLRASRQRTFLAVLLVNHGRVVSVDRLIEDVWPGSPPAGARHALETHASRLRSLLGEDLPLLARPPGYVLDLDPHAVDSVRFEQLLAEARDLLATDPARAASRAADALALWRGEPLAEFTYESFAQEEVARLSELRLEAEEVGIDAELARGRSADLVGELESLVAAAPLRERRRAQLMLALYRAGRQADALEAFRNAREQLLEELGLEPGAELRELECAILQQDPELGVVAAALVEAGPTRRLVSVVAVEPELSLDLDPEEHARLTGEASEVVARVAAHFDGERPEPFVLLFVQEDHGERAQRAASELDGAVRARVGVASGEALVGPGGIAGPLIERARRSARDGEVAELAPALERRTEGPFVGRQGELAQLRTARAALVVGPPGIGKSRLVHELGREERVLVGHCSSYGAEALGPLCEVLSELGHAEALDDVAASDVPLTFRRICEAAGGLVVAFDDAQWADPIVLETIEHLGSHASDAVRLVCLTREELVEERPAFLAGAERVALEPLAADDALALAERLGADDPAIAARAEGNPLFIEQLLAHAAESADALPSTLQSLLVARLDRLAPAERLVIERAAVLGREFDGALVGELLESRNPRSALLSLARRGLLDPAPPTSAYEERFRFRHALIHEAAYGSVTTAERARLHEATADVLDVRGAADEVIGFHLERAAALLPEHDRHAQRLAEDAGRRLGAAGMSAWRRGDAAGAGALFTRAVSLLPVHDGQRHELLCELGVARATIGDRAGAGAVLDEAAELGDRRIQLRAILERAAFAAFERGGAAAVVEAADEAAAVFAAVEDDRALGRALMLSGWVRGGAYGHHTDWLNFAEEALVHYQRARFPAGTCIAQIAAALHTGPTPVPDAIARCRKLLAEVTDLPGDAHVSAHLGGLHAMAEDFAEADRLLQRTREIFTELGRLPSLLRTSGTLEARVAVLRGDLASARRIYEATCEGLVAEGGTFHLATQAAELAAVLLELDQVDDARRFVELAESGAHSDDVDARVKVRLVRARLAAHDGDGPAARALAVEGRELADTTDDTNLRAFARVTSARVADDPNELAAAIKLYELKGNTAAARRVAAAVSGEPAS